MLDQQPFLFSWLPAANFDQYKTSGQLATVQNKLQFATIDLLGGREIAFHFEGALVPEDHLASAIISLRYFALKLCVLERMIFGLNGQALIYRIHRWTLRHGPGFHHAIHFQTEIVVQASRVMFLNNESRSAMRRAAADRLWCGIKAPFAFVFFKRHRPDYRLGVSSKNLNSCVQHILLLAT